MPILFNQMPFVVNDGSLPLIPAADVRYLSIIESGAVEHWLFGGGPNSLIGLKGVKTLVPQSNTETYASNSINLVSSYGNALASNIADAYDQTMIAVVKRVSNGAKAPVLYGTVGSTAGSGVYYSTATGGLVGATRPIGSPPQPAYPAGLDVGEWMFVAYCEHTSEAGATKKRDLYIGAGGLITSATNTSSTAKTLSSVNPIAVGNGYYSDTAFNGGPNEDFAEFMYFSTALSATDVAAIFRRSASRMAARGITL